MSPNRSAKTTASLTSVQTDRSPLTERSANDQIEQPAPDKPAPEQWAMVEALLQKPAPRAPPSAIEKPATTRDMDKSLTAARPYNELSARPYNDYAARPYSELSARPYTEYSAAPAAVAGPADAVFYGDVSANFINTSTNGIPFSGPPEASRMPNMMGYPPVTPSYDQAVSPAYKSQPVGTKRRLAAMSPEKAPKEDEDLKITEDCDQVREKITSFIENGGMKPGEFIKEMGVNSKTYYTFMKYSGPFKGSTSSIYPAAFHFFRRREKQGLQMPKRRKTSGPPRTFGTHAAAAAAAAAASASAALADQSIVLDGEREDEVPVYDNCDEVRRKINMHLRKASVTPASFLRQLDGQTHSEKKSRSKLQGIQLTRFRAMNGPFAGNTQVIYYSAYVFFEKERLAEGKPKTKHRLDMESEYEADGGIDVKRKEGGSGGTYMLMKKDELEH
jgi:hypothetical protein